MREGIQLDNCFALVGIDAAQNNSSQRYQPLGLLRMDLGKEVWGTGRILKTERCNWTSILTKAALMGSNYQIGPRFFNR